MSHLPELRRGLSLGDLARRDVATAVRVRRGLAFGGERGAALDVVRLPLERNRGVVDASKGMTQYEKEMANKALLKACLACTAEAQIGALTAMELLIVKVLACQ